MFRNSNKTMTALSAQISEAMKNLPVEETEVAPTVRQYVAVTFVVVGRDVRSAAVSSTKAVAGVASSSTGLVASKVTSLKASREAKQFARDYERAQGVAK